MPRNNEFRAHRYLRKTRNRHGMPHRSDDKDWRKVAAAVVIVAVCLAIWWTW